MGKYGKTALLVVAILLLGIQFIKPEKNQSGNNENNIANKYNTPDDVKALLKTACNDCHSNYTTYPWYNNIQPVAFWLAHHVDEGKRELNLSEFLTYGAFKQMHKMEETVEMVNEGEMPLNSYTWTHTDARLTQEQKDLLVNWAQSVITEIKATYPPDSLVRPARPPR